MSKERFVFSDLQEGKTIKGNDFDRLFKRARILSRIRLKTDEEFIYDIRVEKDYFKKHFKQMLKLLRGELEPDEEEELKRRLGFE